MQQEILDKVLAALFLGGNYDCSKYLKIKRKICTEKNALYDESGCERCEICSYEDDEPKVAIEIVQSYGKIVDPNTDNIIGYLKRKSSCAIIQ